MSVRGVGRLVVCDPCLAAVGTHPWACAAALLSAAREAGWRGDIVARTVFRAPEQLPAGVALHPILRHPGASKLTASAELDRLEGRSRGWRPPWQPLVHGVRRDRRATAFAADLRPLVGTLRPGEQFLVATATEIDALGLARAIAAVRPAADVGWHLWFHAPLFTDGRLPSADARLGRVRRFLAAATRLASPHRLRFWATTAELAAEWTAAGGVPVGVLPMPVSAPAPASAAAEHRPLRVAVLGDARPEKGSAIVGALLDRVAADPLLATHVHFAIQTNPGFPPRSRRAEDRAVEEALERVKRHAGPGVEILAGPLGPERYREEIARADALLLPYDAVRYRHRCSGVLLEAMAAGKVAIVTAGGWMARQFHDGLRRHADRLAERHPPLAEERLTAIDLPPRGEIRRAVRVPSGADTLLLEATWTRPATHPETASAWAFDQPLRLRLWGGCAPESIVLAADGEGLPTPAVVRVANTVAAAIVIDSPRADDAPRVASLSLRWLRCGGEAPVGDSGLVLSGPSVDAALEALGELVAHRGHYRARAIDGASAITKAHSPATVLGRLVA